MDVDVAASPASASESEPWTRDPPSTSSQHDSYSYRSRSSRRASNRVKPKPASPHVISSILSSLEDTLAPLPAAADYPSETASKLSHSDSVSRSVVSSASVHRIGSSPGFGVEYGNNLALDDEDGLSGAALPPTIPTSRSPSGLSRYSSKRHSSFPNPAPATAASHHRTDSRRSSFSATSADRPGSRRNYLSSESWVRRNADGDAQAEAPRGRSTRKSLRRVSSHEALRSSPREPSPQASLEPPSVSLAEKIIARTPPPISTSKGRLFLNDTTVNEDLTFESPISPLANDQSPITERGLGIERQGSYDSQLSVSEAQFPKVPSPIIDSIPMRTSSLRQKGNSPAARKKRGTKSKSKSPGASSINTEAITVKQSTPPIQDSSWIDLGEDDETVRRIKELRERRKSRLQESTIDPSSFGYHVGETQVYERPNALNKQTRRDLPVRPIATRASTEPENGQRLPIERNETTVLDNGGVVVMNGSRETSHNLESRRSLSAHRSIRSDNSPIPPSIDYSYARAVDLLGSEESFERENGPSFDRASEVVTPTRSNTLAPPPNTTSAKKAKRSPSDRWTVLHPDAPLDFDKKKSRRKSMNDARHVRTAQEREAMARRDSVEDAVEKYLNAPRLSRTIKNARSGRTIAFSEVGDPKGAAVFICVGMGLTRYVTAFFDELATTLRLRLITLDRPGVGGSEPLPATDKSGPLGWPEDVLTVCQHLGIVNFSILAHSAGAIYALATALIVPHLIKGKVHLLAPWVPPSQLEAISHPTASAPPSNPLPRSQRFLRVLPTPFLKAANSSFMTATSASLKPATKRTTRSNTTRTPPRRTNGGEETYASRRTSSDRPEYRRRESMMLMDQFMPETNPLENFPISVLEEEGEHGASMKRGSLVLSATASPMDPGLAYATNGLNAAEHAERERQIEYTSQLTHRTWELATRDSNPATDLVVCLERTRDVGFRYTDVGREVVITHGSEDKRVPVANVKWLAEQMNRRAPGLSVDGRESRESWAEATARGGCEVRVLTGEGHGLMASPVIMGDVLTEIASYWAGSHDKGRL